MNAPKQKTSAEWFHEAARCYIEGHQACAWCGGAYRVFHKHKNGKHIYYCQGCDFQAGYDERSNTHFSMPGSEALRNGIDTMFVI